MKTTTTALLFLACLAQVAVSVSVSPVSHKVPQRINTCRGRNLCAYSSRFTHQRKTQRNALPQPVKFTPEIWNDETAPELFDYTNNVINAQQDFIHAIEGVVKSVAKTNGLVFQSRPHPKTEQRFTVKFNESLGIYSKSSGKDNFTPMKQWLVFSGVFGDFAAVRVTPHNGGVITDTKAINQEISDRMKQKLPDLGFTADETWESIIGRDNTMSRLFINLTPNAEFLQDVRVTMEIQVIHTVETAIAFTANSVASHVGAGFPKMTKIKSTTLTKKNKKTGGEDSISLLDFMTTMKPTNSEDVADLLTANGFEVPESFIDFYTEQKKKYQPYEEQLSEDSQETLEEGS